ncbi:NfeD family protein [Candidatus Margulisiibacteriota bacterium]
MINNPLLTNPKLIWLLLGILLCIIEIFMPGLIIIFFGLGAITVGLICFILKISINIQLTIFIFTSITYLILFRKWFMTSIFFKGKKETSIETNTEFVGEQAVVVKDVGPDAFGKVELHGTLWTAKAKENIPKGEKVKVINKDNLTLEVKKL